MRLHSFAKVFGIKPILNNIKTPQANALVEWMHQVILNVLVTNDIDNKVFVYIYTWGETLAYIAWDIRASYHFNIGATSSQDLFGKDNIFNLVQVVYWRVITAKKKQQVEIDNV